MSTVTKCDICEAIYGYNPEKSESRVSIFRSKHFHNPETDSSFDLCPDCTNKMLEFIDVLKSGNRYVICQDDGYLPPDVKSLVFFEEVANEQP